MKTPVSLADIQQAAKRIRGAVLRSPCLYSAALSELTGMRVFCKLENLQRTGSFKERGARNALALWVERGRRRGVVAASAGNHALALAYHGGQLEVPVTVVMPENSPLVKVDTCRRLGARVLVHGADFGEAYRRAAELVASDELTYISGYDDPAVIAGQGTLGIEVLEQVPEADAVVCPVGGGGLIAGLGLAVKGRRPDVTVIGVESRRMAGFSAALRAKGPVTVPARPTLADGLAVRRVGVRAYDLAADRVDQVVTVGEDWIALGILRMAEIEKTLVEGAGATPLAALLAGALPRLKGRNVVLLVSGGNIDPLMLGRVILHGMAADGRLSRFAVQISDRPGGLAALSRTIASCGASIHDIRHDRIFSGADVSSVRAECTVETRNRVHAATLRRALRRAGFALLSDRRRGIP